MLPLIVFLLVIMGGSFFYAARFNKRFEETLIITIIGYILFTFLMGMIGLLRFAVYVVLIIALALYVLGIVVLVKNREWKRFLNNFFTPGFVIFMIVCVVFLMGIRGKVFTDSDEFSHWGDVVKVMVQTGNFGSHPDSGSIFKSYPPGVSIFQYLFECIGTLITGEEFVEWYCYFGLNILYIAVVLPVFNCLKFKNVMGIIAIVVATIGLPYLYFLPSFITLYVELLLAFMFAGLLLDMLFNEEKDIFFDIRVLLMLAFMVLAKDSGLLFAIFFGIAYVLIKVIRNNAKLTDKRNIVVYLSTLLAVFVPKLLWSLNNTLNHVNKSFGNKFDFVSLINVLLGKETGYRRKVLGNFIEKMAYGYIQIGDTGIYLNYTVIALVLLAMLSFIVYLAVKKCRADKKEGKVVEITAVVLFVVYIAGLMITYMYKFSEFEAVELASFYRYVLIVYLGLSLFAAYGFAIYTAKALESKHVFNLIIIAAVVFCTPMESVVTFTSGAYVGASISLREPLQEYVDIINDNVESGSKVWYIFEGGSNETRLAIKYGIRPNYLDGDVSIRAEIKAEDDGSEIYSAEEWMDMLCERDYDYVATYHIDDQFIEEYGELFENKEDIADDSIFAVDADNRKLVLIY